MNLNIPRDKNNKIDGVCLFIFAFSIAFICVVFIVLYFEIGRQRYKDIYLIEKKYDSLYNAHLSLLKNRIDSIIMTEEANIINQIREIENIRTRYEDRKEKYKYISDDSLAIILRSILRSR